MEIDFPKVEGDKKATLGSNANKRAIRTHDLEILINLSADGNTVTFVSATKIVFPLETIIVMPKISSFGLASTTFFNFSIEAA